MAGCKCNEAAVGYSNFSHICIGSSWIFNNLSGDEKSALAASAVRREYNKGESLFLQGDIADRMFLIKAGRLKLSKVMEDGTEFILDFRKEGDFLGEQIFWDDFAYQSTAECLENSFICSFKREAFEKLVLEYPSIGLNVIKNLSKHIEFLNSRDSYIFIKDLKEKLYELLINLGREHGNRRNKTFELGFPLSHEELGFILGVHRVSITKTMKLLKNTGLIRKEGKTLFVSEVNGS